MFRFVSPFLCVFFFIPASASADFLFLHSGGRWILPGPLFAAPGYGCHERAERDQTTSGGWLGDTHSAPQTYFVVNS